MAEKLSPENNVLTSWNGQNPNLKLKPGLYFVATPIGNLRDVTLRALDVLAAADIIACEDTRVSGIFLKHYGINKKLMALHDHNEADKAKVIAENIEAGKIVAYISDAGMPLISDPGYKLLQECLAAGFYVTSIPGASSALMGLQLSGLPSDAFTFLGFLPVKSKARKDILNKYRSLETTLIFFESANRIKESLKDIEGVFGARQVCMARELTKFYEETLRGKVQDVLEILEGREPLKGEIVLIVEGADNEKNKNEISNLEVELKSALETMSVKDAVSFVSEISGISKKEIYKKALEIKK